MAISKKTFALIVLITIAFQSLSGQVSESIVIGQILVISSDTLSQDREILISLPKSYNDTVYSQKNYPVIYILDAQEHFDLATGIIRFMSSRLDSKLIPEFIIVGIKSINRIKDFTPTYAVKNPEGVEVESFKESGGGDEFMYFLENELMPIIDDKYRTVPYRILIGHSLGGLLAVDDALSQTPVFNGHISMDPSLWWDNDLLARTVKSSNSASMDSKNIRLFISGAHNSSSTSDTTAMRMSQLKFYDILKSKISSESRIEYRIFENEDHGMVPLPSIYHGLQFIFANYRMDNMVRASAEDIQNHFTSLSRSTGLKLLPSERILDIIGGYFANSKTESKKGIEWLSLNTTNYPESYHAFYSLGKAQAANGDTTKAMVNFKESLKLKPSNNLAKQELQKLGD